MRCGENEEIDIAVFDDDLLTQDDLVGKLSLNVDRLWDQGGSEEKWTSLDGIGEVLYSVTFTQTQPPSAADANLSIVTTSTTFSELSNEEKDFQK